MSGLQIPTNPLPNGILLSHCAKLDVTDKVINDLPSTFSQNGVTPDINQYIRQINNDVAKYISNAELKKQNFVQDIKNTHEQLENTLAEFIKNHDNPLYQVEIKGTLNNSSGSLEWTKRTIDLWNKHNYGKSLAVTNFVNELKYKGWKPQVVLSEVRYNDDPDFGGYSGGENIVVSCDFGALDQ